MNARLISRGVPSCPSECHCNAASRCGKPYVNEKEEEGEEGEKGVEEGEKRKTKTLTKEELFALRPGRGGPISDDRKTFFGHRQHT